MPIKNYSKTPSSNNASPPNGFPEGMAPASLNDGMRQVMADIRTWYEDPLWIDFGDVPTFTTGSSFTIPTDVTTRYSVGKRVRLIGSLPFTVFGTVSTSTYSAPNTTITVTLDSGSIGATLNAIALNGTPDASVSNVMLANMAANTVKARAASSAGAPSDVALAASQLLGRGSTGDIAAITLGAGLSMTGAELSSSAGGRIINVQNFTSSGTYTRSAGVTRAIVILCGATGGGSANLTNNGTAGGTTSLGSLISCTGGAGGTLKTVDDTFIPPASGSPTGGFIIGMRKGGVGASGYDGGGQWRFGQPGGDAPVILGYVTPGATETVTIGAAGVGGAAGVEAGQNGLAGNITIIELS